MKTSIRFYGITLLLATWLGGLGLAQAQLPSLVVGNVEPLCYPVIGWPFADGSLVEIRGLYPESGGGGGTRLSPTNDPERVKAHNPLIHATVMGTNVIQPNSGMFSTTFRSNELVRTGGVYVRAYDFDSQGSSLYYADSKVFDGAEEGTIPVEFEKVRLVSSGEEDDEDSDGDGIPDVMESELLGTDPNEKDTDGDGWNDLVELQYPDYLQATEPNPIELEVEPAKYDPDTEELVTPTMAVWWTIPTVPYRLDFTEDLGHAEDMLEPVWTNIWDGVVTEAEVEVDIHDLIYGDFERGFFRVRAIPPDVSP